MEQAATHAPDPLVAEALEVVRQLRDEVAEASMELELTSRLLDERTRKLHAVESALSIVLEEVDDVVLAVDGDTVVQAWSREAERWSDIPLERAIGRRLGDLVKDDRSAELLRAVRAVAEAGPDADEASDVELEFGRFRVRPLRTSPGAVVVGQCDARLARPANG